MWSIRSLFFILPVLFGIVYSNENPIKSRVSPEENIFRKFLESEIDENDIQLTTAGKKQNIETMSTGGNLGVSGNEAKTKGAGHVPTSSGKLKEKKEIKGFEDAKISSFEKGDQNPEVQPELTFEAPTSATFLLGRKNIEKKAVVLSEIEVEDMRKELKGLDESLGELGKLRNRLDFVFKKINDQGKKADMKSKQPTDVLNYNFIEVTEAGSSEK